MDKLLINLGSGQRKFEQSHGWVNVDCQEKWTPDVLADLRQPMPMFLDNSAQMIVLHHMLEHVREQEADGIIDECYRILAPGGSLIVIVPDLRGLVKGWIKGLIPDYNFIAHLYGAWMGHEGDAHRHAYTNESLTAKLQRKPWATVGDFDWRPIEGADIAAKSWWFMGSEAVK